MLGVAVGVAGAARVVCERYGRSTIVPHGSASHPGYWFSGNRTQWNAALGDPNAAPWEFNSATYAPLIVAAATGTTFINGLSTGNATNPDLVFQTGVKTSSGSTQATATTALTLKGETQDAVFASTVSAPSGAPGAGHGFSFSDNPTEAGLFAPNLATVELMANAQVMFTATGSASLFDFGVNTIKSTAAELVGTAFASLPTPVAGMQAYVDDGKSSNCGDSACTTWGTTVTGGSGSLNLLVWYNGTNWTLIGK